MGANVLRTYCKLCTDHKYKITTAIREYVYYEFNGSSLFAYIVVFCLSASYFNIGNPAATTEVTLLCGRI
jgi:hypothetical protein